MFRVPESLSPPSTPDSKSQNTRSFNPFSFSNPSTTPAAPPPTSLIAASTTPAGPPPPSLFGSSQKTTAPIPFPYTGDFAKKPSTNSPLKGFQSVARNAHSYDEGSGADDGCLDSGYEAASLDHNTSNGEVTRTSEKSNIHEVARSLAQPFAQLHEPDELVLKTEDVIEGITHTGQSWPSSLLPTAVQALVQTWLAGQDRRAFGEFGAGLRKDASPVSKAALLSSLLFTLHHPPRKSQTRSRLGLGDPEKNTKPLPEALLDWLRDYHYCSLEEFDEVLNHKPNCAAHDRFWDVIYIMSVRGELRPAVQLLKEADFTQAATAMQDGSTKPGYYGKQLGNVQRVVGRAIQVLQSCPALTSGDWSVHNADWMIFRKRVSQAVADLDTFAQGTGTHSTVDEPQYQASSQGDESYFDGQTLRVDRKIPWSVYQNLGYLYGQLMGTQSEILAACGDWLEALIGMTVWWSGDEDDAGQANLAASRRASQALRGERLVDTHPHAAYRQKLETSFRQIADGLVCSTDDPEMRLNPADSVEVGIGCICVGDLEGLFGIVRGWSSAIATAIVETADAGRWLGHGQSASDDLLDGFDNNDLMVLSYAKQELPALDKDRILGEYARLLNERDTFHLRATGQTQYGWQLAMKVLGRMNNREEAASRIELILDGLPFNSSSQVDQTVSICDRVGLPDLARGISLRYADQLTESSHNYGEAIMHYVKANHLSKTKQIVDLLTSLSLVQSMAYPPISELDEFTLSLLSTPKDLLARIDRLEPEAGEMLMNCITGYATVRCFYEWRDQEIRAREQQKPKMRALHRKKEAAGALVAAIMSASDGIHGGLYDESVQSAMQVDGLLVLLGEALAFINQPQPILTPGQTFATLKAVEDLSTVSGSIRAQCEECFKSSLACFYGSDPPSPRNTLKKSMSASTMATSRFSLIGSEILPSQSLSKELSGEGSGVLVKGNVERGWDWRKGLDKSATGDDVLRILRLGLAKEISKCWLEDR